MLKTIRLVRILGKPTSPKMIHQRPILGDVRSSVQSEMALARSAKPGSIMNKRSSGFCSAFLMITAVATVTKNHTSLILVFPTADTWSIIHGLPGGSEHS